MDLVNYPYSAHEGGGLFFRSLNSTTSDEPNLWYVGVIIYALGAFSMALGVVLQKYSINKEMRKHPDPKLQRPLPKQPVWVLGLVLYGSSGGMLSAALGFAAQSLLTPLMSIVIISNALLARIFLQEPVTKRDAISIGIIIVAVVATTISAPDTENKPTTEELIELYKEPGFIIYVIILVSLMSFFYLSNRRVKKKMVNHEDTTEFEDFIYSFSFGGSAGCWGGLSVTMMKSAITIIQDKINGDGFFAIFTTPITWILLIVLGACWYFQLRWINWGLERYPAVFIVSIEAVLNKIVGVCGGILYFQEFKLFTPASTVGFVFGLCLGVFGIIMFALRDNTVGPEADFLTCCPLKQERALSFSSIRKKQSIKSVVSGDQVIYVDENGKEIDADSNAEEVIEHVESPIHLLVEGTAQGFKALGGILWGIVAPEEDANVRRNNSRAQSRVTTNAGNENHHTL
mmetsp:Transcript_11038/g.12617  ORF Transcript_11038/g.12617 Transcript_11038/m.12617 type:complete len:458 (-) Transcript_11038:1378-2751(-)|eukprot:CAMPEP_0184016868 /NCGR_PEP_ID=MMETSP0954-20121128/7178_1 /TAXON_ID=627963 /ORGANISM="Aplanochytrium sp, Strain PBS07" /LENGTH=457 /DNA_ID=CAMNT_0026297957 /DNA_START=208 /DNA_END=1581 /DNA_ORIENTATION=-